MLKGFLVCEKIKISVHKKKSKTKSNLVSQISRQIEFNKKWLIYLGQNPLPQTLACLSPDSGEWHFSTCSMWNLTLKSLLPDDNGPYVPIDYYLTCICFVETIDEVVAKDKIDPTWTMKLGLFSSLTVILVPRWCPYAAKCHTDHIRREFPE